jgi:aspartyl-tRNA(Asn)/glutamyl-tRNA(Gln) amidotransferase subunit A
MTQYTVTECQKMLKAEKVTSVQLVKDTMDWFKADKKNNIPLNAFLEVYEDALKDAEFADAERASAKAKGAEELAKLLDKKPLLGVPFAVKDNMSVKGEKLTCASKILQGYVAPYNATVVQRLRDAGGIPVGRCNQDEFAMGSSTEYSAYGATRNPLNRECVSGGSSGGSAATVAANLVPFSLGTETGGSVRLPASYCGLYGLKPSYGILSRWGIVAFGSSLDQVGILGHTPNDIALPLGIMSGQDFYDDTSLENPSKTDLLNKKGLEAYSDIEFSKLKVAIPRQFLETKGLDEDVSAVFECVQKWFKEKGATIDIVDLPILNASIACYYVIALSEAASNLSRFDGIRYGKRVDPEEGYDALYVATRSDGFGPEVKRRIVIGNYVLSEQFSGNTYKKAMSVRARMQREVAQLYKTHDIIICPTCPTPAFKLGQKIDDPMAMYLSDIYTIFVNLSRTTSLSVPAGQTKDGLPVGIQFAGPMFSEKKLLSIAQAWDLSHPSCGIPLKEEENILSSAEKEGK